MEEPILCLVSEANAPCLTPCVSLPINRACGVDQIYEQEGKLAMNGNTDPDANAWKARLRLGLRSTRDRKALTRVVDHGTVKMQTNRGGACRHADRDHR